MKEERSELFKQAEEAYENDQMDLAVDIFERLALDGMPEACNYLGLIYRTGDGVGQNELLAKRWYQRQRDMLKLMAEKGDCQAALSLGKIYQYGNQVEVDCNLALSYILFAAENQHSEAMVHLANLYRYGWCGLQSDKQEYNCWLDQAVFLNDPEALFQKGVDLFEFDATQSIKYLEYSAERGYQPASQFLADNLKIRGGK